MATGDRLRAATGFPVELLGDNVPLASSGEGMAALAVPSRHSHEDARTFLAHLQCAPRGFGAPSTSAFAAELQRRSQEDGSDQALIVFVVGEPLSGKSTFVSSLINWLTGSGSGVESPRVKLIRWGDAMRAERHLGLLPADRVPGDLSAAEFARLSAFVGEQLQAARTAVRGAGLVIAEFPGCTAVATDNGIEGLDRGFSTCRAFVTDARAYYVAITAEPRLRTVFLGSRETSPSDATSARSATPLAANRIYEQVTQLMLRLHDSGRLVLPGVASAELATRFDHDPAQRDQALFEWFLPHLLEREIGVPQERALVARNMLLPPSKLAIAQADMPFVDQFDYIRQRYGV